MWEVDKLFKDWRDILQYLQGPPTVSKDLTLSKNSHVTPIKVTRSIQLTVKCYIYNTILVPLLYVPSYSNSPTSLPWCRKLFVFGVCGVPWICLHPFVLSPSCLISSLPLVSFRGFTNCNWRVVRGAPAEMISLHQQDLYVVHVCHFTLIHRPCPMFT